MNRLTHVLACLYALTAIGLLYCATISHRNGANAWAAFLYGAACLLAVAVIHHAYHRDELRFALRQLERASRPPDPPAPAEDGVVAVALAAACCERWWTSAGAEHDPEHCTRKDQTT